MEHIEDIDLDNYQTYVADIGAEEVYVHIQNSLTVTGNVA